MNELVLDVKNLRVASGDLAAVRGLDLAIAKGQRVGLVGESGSGKSMTALGIMGLLPAGWSATGSAVHDGVDLLTLPDAALAARRGKTISMIFQDPMMALNPVRRVGRQVTDVIRRHLGLDKAQARERVLQLFREMRLPRPEQILRAYPHELSGGQRQRIMIATAVACSPALIIADEPTTALDVTVQKEVLRLLDRTVEDSQSALLLITHSLPVVASMCEMVGVMYGGTLVEFGPIGLVFGAPRHPYTEALLRSQPTPDNYDFSVDSRLPFIAGSVPPLRRMPAGCPFRNRCVRALDGCEQRPPLEFLGGRDRLVACWNPSGSIVTAIDMEATKR